jgi:hypothetical protein
MSGTITRIKPLVAVLLAVLWVSQAGAKPKPAAKTAVAETMRAAAAPQAPIDTAKVRKLYLDGDFEVAIDILETAIREKRAFTHADSVFYCKHLGVMYAAKYDTREKGKYYMHQLLMVEPTARILDMYASDMIYMIFKNIQDEFDAARMRLGRAEKNWKGNGQADPLPVAKTPDPKPAPQGSGHALVWVGAATAVVAAGVAAYFIFGDSPSTKHVDAQFQ